MKNHTPHNPDELHRQAEERLSERQRGQPTSSKGLAVPGKSEVGGQRSPEDTAQTLHELRVHQVELEMQNEELRTAQAEIEAGWARYSDLYDLAPVGYCTVSEKGLILEANLTAATLLGTTRGALVKHPLSRFILKEDQDIYYLHRKKLFDAGEAQECDLRLVKPDGSSFWAHLKATAAQAEDGAPVCRMVISDITERKRAEEALRESEATISKKLNAILEPDGDIETLNLADIIDSDELQSLMEDFYNITQIGGAILDISGKVLVGVAWTDICRKFHRVHLETANNCLQSDLTLASGVPVGTFKSYRCKNNMWDMVSPIEIGGKHLGNIYIGQFFYEDEHVDYELFKKQARQHGFDEMEYIAALDRVPRLKRETINSAMAFYSKLAVLISSLSYSKIKLSRDIAELKKADEQIRFQANIMDNSPVIAAYHDKELNVVWVNKAYQVAIGLSMEEVRGKKCYQVWNLSGPCRGCPVITAIETGEKAAHELTPDNQDHWPETQGYWLSQASPVRDEQGTVIGALEFAIDITERKQAETYREMRQEILRILNEPGDLQESIQRVLATLKTRTGADAVGLRLQEGEDFPYFAQDGFSQDFLLAENTLVERGKDCGVCRDKDGKVSLECTCGLVISGKTDPSNPLFTKGGSCWTNDAFPLLDLPSEQDPRRHPRNNCIHQGYASVALMPIRTDDRIVGLIQINDKRKGRFTLETIEILEGIAAHIGSALMRKQAEAEQEKLQAQLSQALKMESIGRLAGGIAHDFNNMLQVILGNTELAMESARDNEVLREDLQQVRGAAKHAAELTRKLLAFASREAVSPRITPLSETVPESINMLRNLIHEGIALEWKPGTREDLIKIDPTQFKQVMINLCLNARDAIDGRGHVVIRSERRGLTGEEMFMIQSPTPGDYVVLSFSDDGNGMDEQTRRHVFEPFFTTKEKGKGTGLGLSTVYGIMKQNDGYIDVQSSPGRGTRFDLYFPACKPAVEVEVREEPRITESIRDGGILLVEDEHGILWIAERMLKKMGYRVWASSSPEKALELFAEHCDDIDMLLTDVIMPEMNGKELADKLAMLKPQIRCVFMSGYSEEVITRNGIVPKDTCFIEKPFDAERLRTVIHNAFATNAGEPSQPSVAQQGTYRL